MGKKEGKTHPDKDGNFPRSWRPLLTNDAGGHGSEEEELIFRDDHAGIGRDRGEKRGTMLEGETGRSVRRCCTPRERNDREEAVLFLEKESVPSPGP